MIPLRDDIPSRTVPVVNYTVIGACTLVFVVQLFATQDADLRLEERFGMVPARVLDPQQDLVIQRQGWDGQQQVSIEYQVAPAGVPNWLTLVTCLFLHGGWVHFLGNMWFLYIFGDNVEDRLGHVGYAIFYVVAGIAASAAHLATNAASPIPTIGASGAIAGVMGAYLLLYPPAKVLTLIPIVFFIQLLVLPAPLFLGIWFVLQLVLGTLSLGASTTGVAWWAHIGGFALGFAVAALLVAVGEARPPVEETRFGDREALRKRARFRVRGGDRESF